MVMKAMMKAKPNAMKAMMKAKPKAMKAMKAKPKAMMKAKPKAMKAMKAKPKAMKAEQFIFENGLADGPMDDQKLLVARVKQAMDTFNHRTQVPWDQHVELANPDHSLREVLVIGAFISAGVSLSLTDIASRG